MCALNEGNIDIINILTKKGANIIDNEIINEKIREKQKKILKQNVNIWINKWIKNSKKVDKNPPLELIKELKNTVKDDYYTIYRGLTWSKNMMDNTIDINTLKIGKKLSLYLNNLTSWSTNYKVAEFYSKHKVISQENDYGIVLKLIIDKSHIFADIRHKDSGEFFSFDDIRTWQIRM